MPWNYLSLFAGLGDKSKFFDTYHLQARHHRTILGEASAEHLAVSLV